MNFQHIRRQQFLSEPHFEWMLQDAADGIANIEAIVKQAQARSDFAYASERLLFLALLRFQRLLISFTGGAPLAPLRAELEQVVAAYERCGEQLWQVHGNRNEPVFQFDVLDEYCQLMQLVGLCFLLHRRDLLPRIAALQDGEGGTANGGADVIYEEFMIHVFGAEKRFATEHACQVRPYENLFYALTESTPEAQIKELDLFLKHWYKDLAGTGWHDSHKPNEKGEQGGYYGYWSFEAGAAVLLLGIEDDSRLHKYLYYPKDMVAWAREHAALSVAGENAAARLRAAAGEPCPREGFWTTPARTSARQHFTLGQVMPDVGGDYGTTLWQWDDDQTP